MTMMEWVPFVLIVLGLAAILICLSIKDYREVKRFEAEVEEKSKNPLYRGTLWIP